MKTPRPIFRLILIALMSVLMTTTPITASIKSWNNNILAQNNNPPGDGLDIGNPAQCTPNQILKNGFCLGNDGKCYNTKQGGTMQGFYTQGDCSPCGYYNKNGDSVNQQCCQSDQVAYTTQDNNFPIVCFDKNTYTCYAAKDPNNPGQQNTYEAQGSANTICSKAWLCQKKSENNVTDNNCPSCPRDSEATISNESGLVACVNKGVCTVPRGVGGMITGFYTEGQCSPCGYYNTNESSPNQKCCTSSQRAIETEDPNNPVVCLDENTNSCFTAKDPNINGNQNPYMPTGAASTTCSKLWLCEYKQLKGIDISSDRNCIGCRPGQAEITNENNQLIACVGNDNKCYTPYRGDLPQKRYTEGNCAPCTATQQTKVVNGQQFCVDQNNKAFCMTTRNVNTGNQSTFKNEEICGCGIDQSGSEIPQFSYPGIGSPMSVCSPCDNTKNQTPTVNNQGKSYCLQRFMDGESSCYTLLNRHQAQKLDTSACPPCGRSNCCPANMIKASTMNLSVASNESAICLQKESELGNGPYGAIYSCKSYTDPEQSSKAGSCSVCGYVDQTGQFANCPICKQGQVQKKVEGGTRTICVDETTSDCYDTLEFRDDMPTQQRFKPQSVGVPIPKCSICGKYDVSKCPTMCLADQKIEQADGFTFCVDQDTKECLTTLGNGSSKQQKFDEAPCKACGKYPNTRCSDDCPPGQTEQKIGGQSICVVGQFSDSKYSSYQCLTLMNTDGTQKPYKPSTGVCAQCGLFKDSYCGGCAPGQETKQDRKTGKRYCVTNQQTCLTPKQFDSDVQKPYKEGECFDCGKTACCPSGSTPSANARYCLSGDRCYQLLNNKGSSDKVPYTDQPCGSCGRYPETLCHACAEGQTLQHDDTIGMSYCAQNSDGACFSTINQETLQQTPYKQSTNPKQPCHLCGKTTASCPAMCTAEQTPQYQDGRLVYCTDLKGMCWAPIGNGESTQSVYSGPECSGCGQYQLTACPNPVCLPGQTQYVANTKAFCVDNTSKQCLNAVGEGITTQSQLIIEDPQHPCAPNSLFCQNNSNSFCQSVDQSMLTVNPSEMSNGNSINMLQQN